jgi:SAM-dependent methyltransferase
MMNVVELRQFYASPLGKATQRLVAQKLFPILENTRDTRLLGLGYAIPYLSAEPLNLAFMLARSGVLQWPKEQLARTALVDELDLPLADHALDIALVVHGLEFTESPVEMLQEIWRVLAPQGRLVLVIPNRRGLWAASDASPFGFGQPFSRSQILATLKEAQFSVNTLQPALLMPPRESLVNSSLANGFEKYGPIAFSHLSGITIVEAIKQVYAYSSGKRVKRNPLRLRPFMLPAPHGRSTQ